MRVPPSSQRPSLGALLDRALVLAGVGCAVYGVAAIYQPAAWIAAGAALVTLAVLPDRVTPRGG
ncbi:MAG: hypothetical protein Q8Q14_16150 [Gemmatimonadales bacterium]|nr:hypothetical protein [Gemmatimonadales bacterium]